MKFKVIPTSTTGESLLQSEEMRPDSSVLPLVSVQLPTEVANASCAHSQMLWDQIILDRALIF